jgi:hypothetical protein
MKGRLQCPSGLRQLKHWDRGFKSHSRDGCLCAFILLMLNCVGMGFVTRWSPSKEFYRFCTRSRNLKESGEGPQQGATEPSTVTVNTKDGTFNGLEILGLYTPQGNEEERLQLHRPSSLPRYKQGTSPIEELNIKWKLYGKCNLNAYVVS